MSDEWIHKAAVEIAQEVDEVSASLKGPRFMFEEFIESVEKKIASHAPSPYRTPEQRKQMARNLLDELGLPEELGRVQMIADILKIWLGSPAPEEKRVKTTEELQKELEHLQFAADNKGVEVNQSRPAK